MRKIAFVLVCVACVGYGRRMYASIGRHRSKTSATSRSSLTGAIALDGAAVPLPEVARTNRSSIAGSTFANLLLAFNSAAAFGPALNLLRPAATDLQSHLGPHKPTMSHAKAGHRGAARRQRLRQQDIQLLATESSVSDEMVSLTAGSTPASEINVAVYGGGSFGTAMACVLARKGIPVKLIVRRPEVVEQINTNHINPYYQSDLLLPPLVQATLDPEEALSNADFIFHAVPMQFSRNALKQVKHLIPEETPVISLTKGIETSTLSFMSDLIPDVLGPNHPCAFVSGPSFAAEIVNGIATAVTVASTDRDLANDLMALFTSAAFRAMYTPDVVGVEVGGAVKNVIAIAAGMSEGLGLGTNAMAALVTRGCSEMRRLVHALGGESSTVFGLSGVGDTFGTCFGPLSRNRQVGYRLGKGEQLDDILESMSQVAEGVATARALTELINMRVKGYRKDLKFPILYGVASILDGEISPREGLVLLMEKYPLRLENFPFH